MTTDATLRLPDARYSTDREFCGQTKPRFIPRFCGEWIRLDGKQVPACVTLDGARAYCHLHREQMLRNEADRDEVFITYQSDLNREAM